MKDGIVGDHVGRDGHAAEEPESELRLAGLAVTTDHDVEGDDIRGGAGALDEVEHARSLRGAAGAAEPTDEAGARDDIGDAATECRALQKLEAFLEIAIADEALESLVVFAVGVGVLMGGAKGEMAVQSLGARERAEPIDGNANTNPNPNLGDRGDLGVGREGRREEIGRGQEIHGMWLGS